MGLKKIKNILINEDKYIYPYPELIIQTTHTVRHIQSLGSDIADNDNGYIYFYADADWKKNPTVYIGESKNSIQSRHNSTHKSTEWFSNIKYPFIGIVNSPNLPWDTDTRRAIESKTVYKLHSIGIKLVNGANSTWTNGGTVHPNVNNQYVEDVSGMIVDYIMHHIGYEISSDSVPKEISKSRTSKPSEVATYSRRENWDNKVSKEAMLVVDTIIKWAREEFPSLNLDLNYQNNYIGLYINGKSKNLLDLHPKRKTDTTSVGFKLDKNEQLPTLNKQDEMNYRYTHWGTHDFDLTTSLLFSNEASIRELIRKSISPALSKSIKSETETRASEVTLQMLIESGEIIPGTKIYSREGMYKGEAEILASGEILFNGTIYETLSAAGKACKRLVKPEINGPNGWEFWATKNSDGILKKLSTYRSA